MLIWFASYLSDRKQRVVIEGVPQGSVLAPLIFLIYKDFPSSVIPNCCLLVDDCLLLEKVLSPSICAPILNYDLALISSWANRWLVTMNAAKTESMIFPSKRVKPDHPPLLMNGVVINDLGVHEHLGFTLSSNLPWRQLV